VIHEWNEDNAQTSRIMLAPVGWESHSAPELGERPQGIINRTVLADCDLLVGVFWTRLGTPTGEAESGTVEEIREHCARGKPAMLYFSAAPVELDSVDMSQYEALKEFRAECETMGLIERYENPEDFRNKLRRHLNRQVSQNEHLVSTYASNTAPQGDSVGVGPRFSINAATLTTEARTLLVEAATNGQGSVMRYRHLSGTNFAAGRIKFEPVSPRAIASWDAAIEELIGFGLLVERGEKGQMFELTKMGWDISDSLVNANFHSLWVDQ